eukprot:2881720-Amphidinium_carterae.1
MENRPLFKKIPLVATHEAGSGWATQNSMMKHQLTNNFQRQPIAELQLDRMAKRTLMQALA